MSVLLDSSIYIDSLRRGGDPSVLLQRWVEDGPLWLSSVVLYELYMGTGLSGHKLVSKLESDFVGANRILVPEVSDWVKAGKILARIGHQYGHDRIGRSRLTNDALIAVSAARTGMKVITANKRDFEILAQFCQLQWQERSDFDL